MAIAKIKDLCTEAGHLTEKGDLRLALAKAEEAVAAARAWSSGNHHVLPLSLTCRGAVREDLGETTRADDDFSEAVDLAIALPAGEEEYVIAVLTHAAWYFRARGRTDDAFKVWNQVLALLERELGEDHPRTLLARIRNPLVLPSENRPAFVTPWNQREHP